MRRRTVSVLRGMLAAAVAWTLHRLLLKVPRHVATEDGEEFSWSAPVVSSPRAERTRTGSRHETQNTTTTNHLHPGGDFSSPHGLSGDDHSTKMSPGTAASTTTPADLNTTTNSTTLAKPGDPILNISKEDYVYRFSWGGSPIVLEEHGLIFFTVPKVACSVWKQLFRRMMGHADWRKPNPHDPKTNGLKYLFDYSPGEAAALLSDPSVVRAIFFRDPKSRFLSVYLDKAVGSNGDHIRAKCCKPKPAARAGYHSTEDCWSRGRASLQGFFELTRRCQDTHWGPQSDRMGGPHTTTPSARRNEELLWRSINFVGHLETVADDTRALLERIGAWEEFGANGWGKHANESLFASTSNVRHATLMAGASSGSNHHNATTVDAHWRRLADYYTPALERAVEERFKVDYEHPVLGLVPRAIVYDEAG